MFTFTEDMIRAALKANGYSQGWSPDSWIHEEDSNPDHSSRSTLEAFRELLRKNNLI